jgi:hypothetical protein
LQVSWCWCYQSCGGSLGGYGGDIYDAQGTATLTSTTLSGKSATDGAGGGLANFGTASLTNVTLSGNSADYGGGLYQNGDLGQTVALTNTIVATGRAGADCYVDGPATVLLQVTRR